MAGARANSLALSKPQEPKLQQRPVGWAVASAAAVLVAFGLIQPTPCTEDAGCLAQHATVPTNLNACTACGLVMVLINEVTSLVSIFHGAKEAQALVVDLKSRYMPSLLMTIMFGVLVAQHSVFAASSSPWFASARPDGRGPIYNLTYIEWLLIVPLLLTISGHCALGRPLEEMARPVIVTNVYIVCAWAAMLTSSSVVRCTLVVVTFLMYFHASWDMIMWVVKYFQTTPEDLPSRFLRPCLSLGLIALFAIYAVIYLSVMTGFMQTRTERLCWLFLDVGSKLAMSAAFVVIRGSAYHKTLTGVLKKMSTSNVAVVSILRGSFDVLLPCTVDDKGGCWLPRTSADDMLRLEGTLQRPVAGKHLGTLLADDVQRESFNAYVRNALRQAEQPKANSDAVVSARGDWAVGVQGQLPPVAQVLNCRMATGLAQPQGAATVGCAIHLSVVPQSAMSFGLERRVVAAVRFSESESAEEDPEGGKHSCFETFDPSNEVDEEPEPGLPFANLKDVARLGLSALLGTTQSVVGAPDDEGGSSYYTTSQTQVRKAGPVAEKHPVTEEGTATLEEEPEPSEAAGTELERREVARRGWDEDSASSVSDFLGLRTPKVAAEVVKPKKSAGGSIAGSIAETEEEVSSHKYHSRDLHNHIARKPPSEVSSVAKRSAGGGSIAETETCTKAFSSENATFSPFVTEDERTEAGSVLRMRVASKTAEKEPKPTDSSGESTASQDTAEVQARSGVTMTLKLDQMQLSIVAGTMALVAVALLRR